MSDTTTSDFERRLQERTRHHQAERAKMNEDLFGKKRPPLEGPPDFSNLPTDAAFSAYDDWLTGRIAVWRGETSPAAAPPQPAAPPAARPATRPVVGGSMPQIRTLDRSVIDDLMMQSFALERYMPGCRTEFPDITPCPTPETFAECIVAILPEYRGQIPGWKTQVEQAPGELLPGNPLSRPALHVQGQGTYLNLWHITRGQSAEVTDIQHNRFWLRQAVAALGAERWGHGFLESYTAWGGNVQRAGHDLYLKQRLGLPLPATTSPGLALLEAVALTADGWAWWVGKYLAQRAAPDPQLDAADAQEGVRLSPVLDGLQRIFRVIPLEMWAQILGFPVPGLDRLVNGLSETLNWLFLNTEMDERIINRNVRRLQKPVMQIGPLRFELSSQRDWISHYLLRNVEAKLGPMAVPYAVLLAANVDFSAAGSATDIRERLDTDLKLNVDSRLILLTRLGRTVQHNVTSLVGAAIHELGMRPPEKMQWA